MAARAARVGARGSGGGSTGVGVSKRHGTFSTRSRCAARAGLAGRPGRRAGARPDPGQIAARPAAGRRNPDHLQRSSGTAGAAGAAGLAGNLRAASACNRPGRRVALRFEPALDAAGRPVIRVTSAAPVQQPLLTFLVEVDWGRAGWSASIRRCSTRRARSPRRCSRRSRRRWWRRRIRSSVRRRRRVEPLHRRRGADAARRHPSDAGSSSATPIAGASAGSARRSRRAGRQPPSPADSAGRRAGADTRPVKAGQTLSQIAAELEPAGYTSRRPCSRCCAPTPKPSSAATSTGSSRAPCCGCRRRASCRTTAQRRPPRSCASRSPMARRRARPTPQPATVADRSRAAPAAQHRPARLPTTARRARPARAGNRAAGASGGATRGNTIRHRGRWRGRHAATATAGNQGSARCARRRGTGTQDTRCRAGKAAAAAAAAAHA